MVLRSLPALKVAIWTVVRTKFQAHQRHRLRMAHTFSKLVNCPCKLSAELAAGKPSSQTSCYSAEPDKSLPIEAPSIRSNALSLALGLLSAYRNQDYKCDHHSSNTRSA